MHKAVEAKIIEFVEQRSTNCIDSGHLSFIGMVLRKAENEEKQAKWEKLSMVNSSAVVQSFVGSQL